jgi:nicotinate-nucleotide pyrophosphorylase (carboxylating)
MFANNETLEQAIERNVHDALMEDIGLQDWTAQLVPEDQRVQAHVVVKQSGAILCGQAWFDRCIKTLDPQADIHWLYAEGARMENMTSICEITANARALLSAERPALNFLQTLSWTATSTKQHVDAIAGISLNPKGCKILETRKTLPGLRRAQKYACTVGGGMNHRLALWDGILIKENHIEAAGSVQCALENARALHAGVVIQIEVETIAQMEEALSSGAEHLLLDDFSLADMRRAVQINQSRAELEVSGGVDLTTVRDIAATGVDRISIGGLTKDVQAIDYSMRILARI